MTSERYGTVGHLVIDVVLFVLYCIMAAFLFRTRRGSRLMGVLSAALAVIVLALSMDQPPLDHLLPSAWQLGISVGLLVLAFLLFFLSPVATIIRRR